jgi:hypothetical protein
MSRIDLDLFPCFLVAIEPGQLASVSELQSQPATPSATFLSKTRVILSEKTIVVAKDSETGPQIVFQEKYDFAEISKKGDLDTRIVTKSGKMLAFRKDNACACGSRLKGWNPYRTLQSIKDWE